MPKQFKFCDTQNDNCFKCNLASQRCTGHTVKGTTCKRNVVMGLTWCWTHLLRTKHLRVKVSQIPNAGKGLYADDPSAAADAVVFKRGDIIVPYTAQLIDIATLQQRYGNKTAPYTLQVDRNHYLDAACKRGAGAFINSPPGGVPPNAKFVVNNHNKTAKIVATKSIRNGREIYVSYGRSYRYDQPGVTFSTK